MHRYHGLALLVASLLVPAACSGQNASDAARNVAGGGIAVPGWTGAIDPAGTPAGQGLERDRLAREGNALHVTTGPAVAYWNPANTASGDYTVKATFREPKFMNLNDHPHPYGVFIAGHDMAGGQRSYLYCAAYGNGRFIVRGFGPAPFQLNGREGEANAAVHRAAGAGQPVEQEVALSVHGDQVRCAVNGTVVASYPKADVVASGRLKSTDGVYGIRFAHNTEGLVTGLTVTRP